MTTCYKNHSSNLPKVEKCFSCGKMGENLRYVFIVYARYGYKNKFMTKSITYIEYYLNPAPSPSPIYHADSSISLILSLWNKNPTISSYAKIYSDFAVLFSHRHAKKKKKAIISSQKVSLAGNKSY